MKMSRLFSLFRRKKPEEAAGSGLPAGEDGVKKEAVSPEVEDPILPEKKRARRRLVGAITITLAAIIVLPMIFESEPKTVSQDILIDIPSRDKPPQTVLREPARKKQEEKTAVPDTAKEAAKPAAPVTAEKKETLPKPAETAVSKPAADSSKEPPKPAAAKSEQRTEKADARPKPESREPAKQDARPAAKDTKPATARKADDPIGQIIAKQQPAPKADEQAKVVIQVAAVSSQDKAKELQDKLKKAGLNSYTQKVALKEGGERIRIRIGPLSGGKEVNQTCAKLSQLKLPCTLVN